MLTISEVGAIVGMAKTALDLTVKVGKNIAGASKDDLKKDVATLTDQVQTLFFKLVEVNQTIAELQEENTKLKNQSKQRDELALDPKRAMYYGKNPDGTESGPFCPRCLNNANKAVPMVASGSRYKCVSCDYFDRPIKPGIATGGGRIR